MEAKRVVLFAHAQGGLHRDALKAKITDERFSTLSKCASDLDQTIEESVDKGLERARGWDGRSELGLDAKRMGDANDAKRDDQQPAIHLLIGLIGSRLGDCSTDGIFRPGQRLS